MDAFDDYGTSLPILSSTLRTSFTEAYTVFTELSRCGPPAGTIFRTDATSTKSVDEFIHELVRAAGGDSRDDLIVPDLSRHPYGEELRDFFCVDATTNRLYAFEVRNGFKHMAEIFIGRSQEIQARANSFVLQLLGAAEEQVMGCPSDPELGELFEKAQLLLLLVPPSSPAVGSGAGAAAHWSGPASAVSAVADRKSSHSNGSSSSSSSSSSSGAKISAKSSSAKGEAFYGADGDRDRDMKESQSEAKLGVAANVSRPCSGNRPALFRSKSTVAADLKNHGSSCFTMNADAQKAASR
jgi:hypothetical protein